MRVLISGGGIAGLTLATLLARQGKHCMVVDRLPESADSGYALALWPQGSRVLHALGLHDAFIAASEPMARYTLQDGAGRLVGIYDLQATVGRYGHIGIIPRSEFVNLLGKAHDCPKIHHDVSIERLHQNGDRVETRLSDGSEDSFDLVIGADGIHSRVRELLFGRLPEWDMRWGCLVWWGPADLTGKGETIEHWGAGRFLGFYPCRNQVCIILGAPSDTLKAEVFHDRKDRIKSLLGGWDAPVEALLASLPKDDETLYLWRMSDVRAPRWIEGRIALIGDAAAAFLPTAGIGASMALESAAVLADILSRTDAAHLPQALDLYVKRRHDRVLAAQRQSRLLARLVFLRSSPLAWVRDRLIRLASLEQMVGPIITQLQRPI